MTTAGHIASRKEFAGPSEGPPPGAGQPLRILAEYKNFEIG